MSLMYSISNSPQLSLIQSKMQAEKRSLLPNRYKVVYNHDKKEFESKSTRISNHGTTIIAQYDRQTLFGSCKSASKQTIYCLVML